MARRKRRDWGRGWVETRRRATGTRYVARWLEDGRQRSKSFDTSEDDAWDFLDDRAREVRRGVARPERTVDDAIALWRERRGHRWSSATRYTYGRLVRLHIEPWFGGRALSSLEREEMRLWTEDALPEAVRVMRTVMRVAVEEGWVPTSPMRSVRERARDRHEHTVWSVADCRKIFDAVKDDPWWRAFYRVLLTTALRRGEILALDWQDVDLKRGTVLVRVTVTSDVQGRRVLGTTTKGKRARRVAITPATVEALEGLPEREGLVFARADGGVAAESWVRERHHAWCRKAGVRPIRIHDLRHTVATLLLAEGVPVKVVSDMIGHSSAVTTMDVYQHTTAEMHRAASTRLGDLYDED